MTSLEYLLGMEQDYQWPTENPLKKTISLKLDLLLNKEDSKRFEEMDEDLFLNTLIQALPFHIEFYNTKEKEVQSIFFEKTTLDFLNKTFQQ